MMRRGFAVRIGDHAMITAEEAAEGKETGPEFVFKLVMGNSNDNLYYFTRQGVDKLCRTFRRIERHLKEEKL